MSEDALPVIGYVPPYRIESIDDRWGAYITIRKTDPGFKDCPWTALADRAAAIAKIRELERNVRKLIELKLAYQASIEELRNKHDAETIRWREFNQMTLARAEAAEARISDLERDGPMVERGERGDGTRVMGTMRQAWEDAIQAADVEAKAGDEARARVAELEQEAQSLSSLVQTLDAKAAELEQQLSAAQERVSALPADGFSHESKPDEPKGFAP